MGTELISSYISRLETILERFTRRLAIRVESCQEDASRPGLSESQRIVLRMLVHHGPNQVSQIAARLGVSLSAVTGLVDRLVKSDLVVRMRDRNDRRVVWIKVTPQGEAALQEAEACRREALQYLVRNLSEDDLATLCDIFERMETRKA